MSGPWEKYKKPWERYAAEVPEGMVFDERTGGYVDTALAAERMGKGQGFIANALSGIIGGGSYVDEAMGAVDGPIAQETFRQARDQYQESNPVGAGVARLGGALLSAVPVAAAASPSLATRAATTVGGRAAQAAGVAGVAGALEGGVYGYGEGETPEERLQQAQRGALFGGFTGTVLGAAGPYAAEGVKSAVTSLRGSGIKSIASALGVSRPTARVIKSALEAGDIDEAMDAMRRAGPDSMLVDAGQPARELLDAAANAGGQAGKIARDAVAQRTSGASQRMVAALDDVLGNVAGQQTLKDGIRRGSAQARQQAYQAAYAQPIDYASTNGLGIEALLSRVPGSAVRKANELMKLEGVQSRQIMAQIADDGSVSFTQLPDVRQIDYITRALNDVASAADGQGKLGGTTAVGRATANLARDLRRLNRSAVPEYGEALDVASDAISQSQATDLGYVMFRAGTKRDDVALAVTGASEAEKQAMKLGLRSYIDDTLANVSRAITDTDMPAREGVKLLRDMSTRANRDKLRMLLGSDADKLLKEIDEAAVTFELRAAIAQNSKTAIRQGIQGTVQKQVSPNTLETLAQGDPINAGKRFVQIFTGATDEAVALREAGIYEEIAKVLTQTKGRKAREALRQVGRALDGEQLTEQQASMIGSVLATTAVLGGGQEATRRLARQ